MKHDEAVTLVTKTAQLFEQKGSDETEILAALVAQGHSEVEARKLYLYVQSAFSWAVLKKIGVVKFAVDFQIRSDSGNTFHVPVASQQLCTIALALGIGEPQHGYTEDVSVSVFESVVAQSAEVSAANKALNNGLDVSDSEIMSTFYGFEPEDFGRRSKSWWQFWR